MSGLVANDIARTSSAIFRTWLMSGPTTRNRTGYWTGGPKTNWVTRTRASGNCPFRHHAAHPDLERITCLGIFGQHDDLGIGGVRQQGVERQDETRRAGTPT